MKSTVSVIIPTHNRSALVREAVESSLAAISPGDEVIVVDDGSEDDTSAVLARFGDRIRYVRIDNAGVSAARNVGMRMARGALVTFLDDDDRYVPDKIELERSVMDAFPELVFSFGNMFSSFIDRGDVQHDLIRTDWRHHFRIGSERAPELKEVLGSAIRYSSIGRLPERRADFDVHIGDLYPAAMYASYVHGDAIMVRASRAGAAFEFRDEFRVMEDYECFARLSRLGPVAYLDCEVADLRVHGGQRNTDMASADQLTYRIRILQGIWGTDESFLAKHGAEYHALLASKANLKARMLIGSGRMRDARQHLAALGGPLPYRIVASLPSPLVGNVIRAKRKLRALLG